MALPSLAAAMSDSEGICKDTFLSNKHSMYVAGDDWFCYFFLSLFILHILYEVLKQIVMFLSMFVLFIYPFFFYLVYKHQVRVNGIPLPNRCAFCRPEIRSENCSWLIMVVHFSRKENHSTQWEHKYLPELCQSWLIELPIAIV